MTEKFYESESYSETEDDFKPAKQAPKDLFPGRPAAGNKQDEKKSQKKPSSNANKGTKQASIKGFFPKKWWRRAVDTKLKHKPWTAEVQITSLTSAWTHPVQGFTFTQPAVIHEVYNEH